MIKILSKLEIEGCLLNILKAIYEKPTMSIILNVERLESCSSSKVRNKTRMPICTTAVQHSTGSSSQNILAGGRLERKK